MEIVLIGAVALAAAVVTLFSGFGLGTVLLPIFALFFPVSVAVGATALVHLANNLFKFGLMARHADWPIVLKFGVPASFAACLGALLLGALDRAPTVTEYSVRDVHLEVTWVGFVVGASIVAFAALELYPHFRSAALPARWLPLGGAISGFFGGLTGSQGVLRTAFLLKSGLSKEAFVATGIVAAVIVDMSRLVIYARNQLAVEASAVQEVILPVSVATVCAFAGSLIGRHLLRITTLQTVQRGVVIMMFLIGIGLMAGLV